MNNSVLGKSVENKREQWDIKLGTTERRRNYFVSESNHHTTNYSTEYLLAIEMKKTQTPMDKPFYLGLSTLKVNKILMY